MAPPQEEVGGRGRSLHEVLREVGSRLQAALLAASSMPLADLLEGLPRLAHLLVDKPLAPTLPH